MKKSPVAVLVAAASLVLVLGQADAADLNRGYQAPYAAPPPPVVARWVGPYIGLNIGYQAGSVSNNPTDPSGIVGGLQAGYNWQAGNFVFGGEGDINLSGADDVFAPWKFSNPWFGTLRARAGVAFGNALFYGTAGLAVAGWEAQRNALSEDRTHLGWTVGAGMELAFNQAWSAKVEYLFLSYADRHYSVTGTDNGMDVNLIRFGVNYRF